jgi:hypothetical protein
MSRASEGIWFPIANNHQQHHPDNDQAADNIQPATSEHDTSACKLVSNPASIRPAYWSPIGSQAKADLIDGYTQMVTDRVRAGWSCHLVTFLFSQIPGPQAGRHLCHEGRGPPGLLDAPDQGSP